MGSGFDRLKTGSALVDKIVVSGNEEAIFGWREYYPKAKYSRWADELDFLIDSGLAEKLPQINMSQETMDVLLKINSSGAEKFFHSRRLYNDVFEELKGLTGAGWPRDDVPPSQQHERERLLESRASRISYLSFLSNALAARSIATYYEEVRGTSAVSLDPLPADYAAAADSKSNAVKITLENVDLPTDKMSWDDIRQMKQDQEYRFHLGRFRAWASEVSSGSLREADIREKATSEIEEYRRYMKASGIKGKSGVISWTLSTSSEVLRNLLDLKPASALGAVVSIVAGRADSRLLESAAPGKQLSIVSYLAERHPV